MTALRQPQGLRHTPAKPPTPRSATVWLERGPSGPTTVKTAVPTLDSVIRTSRASRVPGSTTTRAWPVRRRSGVIAEIETGNPTGRPPRAKRPSPSVTEGLKMKPVEVSRATMTPAAGSPSASTVPYATPSTASGLASPTSSRRTWSPGAAVPVTEASTFPREPYPLAVSVNVPAGRPSRRKAPASSVRANPAGWRSIT